MKILMYVLIIFEDCFQNSIIAYIYTILYYCLYKYLIVGRFEVLGT